jgi:hypothetical protein
MDPPVVWDGAGLQHPQSACDVSRDPRARPANVHLVQRLPDRHRPAARVLRFNCFRVVGTNKMISMNSGGKWAGQPRGLTSRRLSRDPETSRVRTVFSARFCACQHAANQWSCRGDSWIPGGLLISAQSPVQRRRFVMFFSAAVFNWMRVKAVDGLGDGCPMCTTLCSDPLSET